MPDSTLKDYASGEGGVLPAMSQVTAVSSTPDTCASGPASSGCRLGIANRRSSLTSGHNPVVGTAQPDDALQLLWLWYWTFWEDYKRFCWLIPFSMLQLRASNVVYWLLSTLALISASQHDSSLHSLVTVVGIATFPYAWIFFFWMIRFPVAYMLCTWQAVRYQRFDSAQHYWCVRCDCSDCGDKVVGMVAATKKADNQLELSRLAVASDVRGAGLGHMLMQQVEDFGRRHGYKEVTLLTITSKVVACRLYKKRGYSMKLNQGFLWQLSPIISVPSTCLECTKTL